MKKILIVHPFLFTIYAVLAPLSNNIETVGFEAIKTLLISISAVIVLSVFLKLIFKNPEKTGLALSCAIFLFFSYGHVEKFLANLHLEKPLLSIFLVVIYGLLFSLGLYLIIKVLRSSHILSNYLNIVSAILVVFPLFSIFSYRHSTDQYLNLAQDYQKQLMSNYQVNEITSNHIPDLSTLPDIYYIILDSYAREDTLARFFGYDNSEFVNYLENKGFYIADQSNSNYSDTVYSMSSSLNMVQINSLPDYLRERTDIQPEENTMKQSLITLMQNNRVRAFLKKIGYDFVSYDSGYVALTTADYFIKSSEIDSYDARAAFDIMLMDTTLGKLFFNRLGDENQPLETMFESHRQRILFTFSDLPRFAQEEGNYFIYAHILIPHSPFVFGPNGEKRRGTGTFTLTEDSKGDEGSPDLYRDQVIYTNKLVKNMIEEIIAKSKTKPIIIIQGDHGSRAYNVEDSSRVMEMELHYQILNAYYFPERESTISLYPTISPVNSFRVLLNTYFGTNLELLPDTSFSLEKVKGEIQFVDICEAYGYCPAQ